MNGKSEKKKVFFSAQVKQGRKYQWRTSATRTKNYIILLIFLEEVFLAARFTILFQHLVFFLL